MMTRRIAPGIQSWMEAPSPPPLLLTGAPQTGKASLARQVAGSFPQSLFYDLSRSGDRLPFGQGLPREALTDTLFFSRNMRRMGGRTFLFLSNLHHSPEAFDFFRRFHENTQGIHLAAGTFISALEGDPDPGSFLTSRVLPLTFREFLDACGERLALEAYDEVPFPNYATGRLLTLFQQYTLTGGMPGAVKAWALDHGNSAPDEAYEKILERWSDALTFTGKTEKVRERARLILQDIFPYAGERITFRHFGNTAAGSREIAYLFRMLADLSIVDLIYPTPSAGAPLLPDPGRTPRLQVRDTGMVGYFSGIRGVLSETSDLNAVFGRQISRQVIGQEFIASLPDGVPPSFWTRAKSQSTAEVDFVIPFREKIIPVALRSGEPGRLRALHLFMEEAPHPYAVRLYAGPLAIRQTETINGKKFFLMSLPYFLAGKIPEHLEGFVRYVEG